MFYPCATAVGLCHGGRPVPRRPAFATAVGLCHGGRPVPRRSACATAVGLCHGGRPVPRRSACAGGRPLPRLSTLQAWMSTNWCPINWVFTSIILIFHQYFGIQDTLLSLNPSGLHFVHPGQECREPCQGHLQYRPGCTTLCG